MSVNTSVMSWIMKTYDVISSMEESGRRGDVGTLGMDVFFRGRSSSSGSVCVTFRFGGDEEECFMAESVAFLDLGECICDGANLLRELLTVCWSLVHENGSQIPCRLFLFIHGRLRVFGSLFHRSFLLHACRFVRKLSFEKF